MEDCQVFVDWVFANQGAHKIRQNAISIGGESSGRKTTRNAEASKPT
ncbi:MAG: hypothetical protein ACLPKW_06745 [Acetobacteraceae bacterium]